MLVVSVRWGTAEKQLKRKTKLQLSQPKVTVFSHLPGIVILP